MIIFNMRERLPKEGDEGIFQLDAKTFSYMIVEKYSTVNEKGDDSLILIDSLGNIADARNYVAWIPTEKLTRMLKDCKQNTLDKLETISENGDEVKPIILVSDSPQEEDFRDFLETYISKTRILFNPSLVSALEYHYADELSEYRDKQTLEKEMPRLVTDFLGNNFDYFCEVKLVEFNA
jgi:hypothetical protein